MWEMCPGTPPGPIGRWQIIPSTGPHDQVYVSELQAWDLTYRGFIEYDPEYGPNARVFRPTLLADTDTVRSWL